jgi:hypothetical protein
MPPRSALGRPTSVGVGRGDLHLSGSAAIHPQPDRRCSDIRRRIARVCCGIGAVDRHDPSTLVTATQKCSPAPCSVHSSSSKPPWSDPSSPWASRLWPRSSNDAGAPSRSARHCKWPCPRRLSTLSAAYGAGSTRWPGRSSPVPRPRGCDAFVQSRCHRHRARQRQHPGARVVRRVATALAAKHDASATADKPNRPTGRLRSTTPEKSVRIRGSTKRRTPTASQDPRAPTRRSSLHTRRPSVPAR